MMIRSLIFLICFSLIGLLSVGNSQAKDGVTYEFVIPLELKHLLKEAGSAWISIELYDQKFNLLGTWSKDVQIPEHGNVMKTLKVPILVSMEKAEIATRYKISMKLIKRIVGGAYHPNEKDEPWLKSRKGSKLVYLIDEKLPLYMEDLPFYAEYKEE